jgi:endonuclease YncB( thermonuclease family)
MKIVINITVMMVMLLLSENSFAGNGSGNEPSGIRVTSIKSVYDGDTFRAFIPNYDTDQRVRVRGVDTPEIKGQCDSEIKAAIKARDYVRRYLKSANKIILLNVGKDKYQRILADVEVDGINLAQHIIEQKLGRKWRGKRESWCH